jgi:hypothetical protein
MAKACQRNYGCRITDDMVYKGMRTFFLENELIRVGILLDKGADIFQLLHKQSDTDFMWKSPQGIVNTNEFKESVASSSGSFLDNYHGGWQDIFPGGGPMVYRGAEIGLHGEVTQLRWDCDILLDTPECVEVKLQTECIRTPFRLEKKLRLEKNNPVLMIDEKITNLSSETMDFMWGQHPAIGAPFLKKGVKLFVPVEKLEVHEPMFAESGKLKPGAEYDWPNVSVEGESLDLSEVAGPDAGFCELLYLKGLKDGWYAVIDPEQRLGLGFSWSKEVFPYIWFWLVYGRAPGYPWWDRVYCIALEPWTSIPNNLTKAIERGVQTVIKGGESLSIRFNAVVITDHDRVSGIDLDGNIS